MRILLVLLLVLSLAILPLAAPVLAATNSGPLGFSLNFLSNLRDNIQLSLTFDNKQKAKLETSLAKAKLDQVSGLTGSVDSGPALAEYSHHLEKAVSIVSKLGPSAQAEVTPGIASVIQNSTPVIASEAKKKTLTQDLSKAVATNHWAAGQITNTPNLSKSATTTPAPITTPTPVKTPSPVSSDLKNAIEAQTKSVQATAQQVADSVKPAPITPPARSAHVLILMYHYVRVVDASKDPLGFALSVTPDDLEKQAAYLEANGFHTIHPAQLVAALQSGAVLPSKPVILTFDDSYRDFYTVALPILQKHHLVATNYVISEYVTNSYPAYMTTDMVKAIDKAGMNVAAHTKTHVDLTRQSLAEALNQIKGSKTTLEAMIGKPVLDFAYPYGSFNAGVAGLVAQAGFSDARTTLYATVHSAGNMFTMGTVRISGGDGVGTFANKVSQ